MTGNYPAAKQVRFESLGLLSRGWRIFYRRVRSFDGLLGGLRFADVLFQRAAMGKVSGEAGMRMDLHRQEDSK